MFASSPNTCSPSHNLRDVPLGTGTPGSQLEGGTVCHQVLNNGGPKLPIYSFGPPAESDGSVKVKTANCDGEVRTVTPSSIGDNKIFH